MGELVVGDEDLEVVGEEERGEAEGKKGMLLRWEKFLPRMIVRVLLVEFDDSTRQIIAVLLSKCGYKVSAVQDGKVAWEILKEKPDNFDLVLSEVSLPILSGFGLLSLIVAHPICKSIPVIMMSSHDSINIVFKCMLQGAVDFLVKPVRKNELRNLWQHVWRRRCLLDGGNGFQIPNPGENKIEVVSDNSSASNHSSDSVPSMHKKRETSPKEIDTQSSRIRSEMEGSNLNLYTVQEFPSSQKEYDGFLLGGNEVKADKFTSKAVETNLSNEALNSMDKIDVHYNGTRAKHCMEENIRREVGRSSSVDVNSSQSHSERHSAAEVIDFLGQIARGSPAQKEDISVRIKECNGSAEASIPKKSNDELASLPPHQVFLKRSTLHCYPENGMDDKRSINHSDASPFLRYTSNSVSNIISGACIGSELKESGNCPYASRDGQCNATPGILFSPKPRRCDTLMNEASPSSRIHSQSPTGSPERIGAVKQTHERFGDTSPRSSVLTEKASFPGSHIQIIPVPLPVTNLSFDGVKYGYGTILQPVFYAQEGPPLWSPIPADRQEAVQRMSIQQSDLSPRRKIPGCSFHRDTKSTPHQFPSNADSSAETDEKHGTSASSQDRNSLCNHRMRNITTNTPGDDSNFKSGMTTDTNMSCCVEGLFNHNGIGEVEYNRSVQRSAALAKFRLKRKERCFDKKVRYESRKILADQRPRVKGQFVRQVHHES